MYVCMYVCMYVQTYVYMYVSYTEIEGVFLFIVFRVS